MVRWFARAVSRVADWCVLGFWPELEPVWSTSAVADWAEATAHEWVPGAAFRGADFGEG